MTPFKSITVRPAAVITFFLVLVGLATSAQTASAFQTNQHTNGQTDPFDRGGGATRTPPSPDAEMQAAKKVDAAKDAPTRLQAATEFIKKYPKSQLRRPVAMRVAAKIAEVTDSSQQITYGESYKALFKGTPEEELILPVMIDAYIKANRLDDAFTATGVFLEKNPSDLHTLTKMAIEGVNQAKKNNNKYLQKSEQYGLKAIQLIEAETRPQGFTDEQWQQYRTSYLPSLYQSLGFASYLTGHRDDARSRLSKAISLNASDPVNYLLLGSIEHDDYVALATKYKSMSPGHDQDEVYKNATAKMDSVIEYYAHAVGVSEETDQAKTIHDQVMADLQVLYKYRHNNSTDGLQQLIDKYKKNAAGPGGN